MSDASNLIFQVTAYVTELYPDLDLCSYYQLLDLPQEADQRAIRSAFYDKAALLHPDRYHEKLAPEVHEKLVAIYARVAEGYRILSDPRRRQSYDADIGGGRLRVNMMEREILKDPEQELTDTQAKNYYKRAQLAFSNGDIKGAEMHIGFALQFQSDSALLMALRDKIVAAKK